MALSVLVPAIAAQAQTPPPPQTPPPQTTPAPAQPAATTRPPESSYSDVPDHFTLDVGFFAIRANTNTVLNATSSLGTTVNFETDLGLPVDSNRAFVAGSWHFARRHRLALSFTQLNRTGQGVTLSRDITWGGDVFPANATVAGVLDSNFWSGSWQIAIYKNRRFEVGPGLGFGLLHVKAGLNGQVSAGGPGSNVNLEGTSNSITGDVGGYMKWWVAKRIELLGDARYIYIAPGHRQESVTEARFGGIWYFTRNVGAGAQYIYNKFRSDLVGSSTGTELGFRYRYDGVQFLASFAF